MMMTIVFKNIIITKTVVAVIIMMISIMTIIMTFIIPIIMSITIMIIIMIIIQQAANFASTTSCTYTHVSRPFLGVRWNHDHDDCDDCDDHHDDHDWFENLHFLSDLWDSDKGVQCLLPWSKCPCWIIFNAIDLLFIWYLLTWSRYLCAIYWPRLDFIWETNIVFKNHWTKCLGEFPIL